MSNLKNWMKIVEKGSDSFDSDHSAENLVNYYGTETKSPQYGDGIDFEFGDKLAIEGTISAFDENECVIDIDSDAMAMLEDLNAIDTAEGYEVLPKMDRDKYQKRDGLEGPIMTRSGKVVYYDNDKGDYYDPDTDMYIDYEDFKALDRKAITAEGRYDGPNSECCDAPLLNYNDGLGICSDCKEHAGPINDDELEEGHYDGKSREELLKMKADAEASMKNMKSSGDGPQHRFYDETQMMMAQQHLDDINDALKKVKEGFADGYASQDEVDDIADSIKSRFMNNPSAMSYIIKNSSIDKFLDAINDVAEFNAPMEEIGSSDMSALMKEVLQNLGLDSKEVFAKESIEEAEENTYTVVHAKHGKEENKASSSYGAAKKYAEMKKLKGTSGIDAHLHTKEDNVNENSIMDPETKKMIPEKDYVMKYVMSKHPEETKKLLQTQDLMDIYGSDLYNALFDYMSEEMPYGTQKGRDGDPVEYMQDELDMMGMFDGREGPFAMYGKKPAERVDEAKYQGKTVKLNKPIRTGKYEPKKFKVYVKDGDKVKLVRFGHQGKGNEKTMKIKKSDPARRKSFRARHNCSNPGPKTKARYWSCRMW